MRRDRREEVEEGLGSKCVRLATYGSRRARSDGGWLKIDPHHSELNPAAALIPPPSLTRIPSPPKCFSFSPRDALRLSPPAARLLAGTSRQTVRHDLPQAAWCAFSPPRLNDSLSRLERSPALGAHAKANRS